MTFNLEKMKRYVETDALFQHARNFGWAKDLPLEKALKTFFNSEVLGNSVAEKKYDQTA